MERFRKIIALLFALLLLRPVTVDARGSELIRLSGTNRVETGIAVSREAYKKGADTVILAGYDAGADALAAAYLAGAKDAPVLLADSKQLSQGLLAEISRLNPQEIILLGGENAIAASIKNELKAKYPTRRIQGKSRVETALSIANDAGESQNIEEVFVVEYNSLVDALAIGPVAASECKPVLITGKDRPSRELENILQEKAVKKVTIIGGKGTVSQKGMESIQAIVPTVERIDGKIRMP